MQFNPSFSPSPTAPSASDLAAPPPGPHTAPTTPGTSPLHPPSGGEEAWWPKGAGASSGGQAWREDATPAAARHHLPPTVCRPVAPRPGPLKRPNLRQWPKLVNILQI